MIVILDDDFAGREMAKQIISKKLTLSSNVIILNDGQIGESEFEDLLKEDFYDEFLNNLDRIKAYKKTFSNVNWSKRIENSYSKMGSVCGNQTLSQIKSKITEKIILNDNIDMFHQQGREIIKHIEFKILEMITK